MSSLAVHSRTMPREVVSLIPAGTGGVHDYAQILGRRMASRILAPTPQTALADYGDGDIVLHFSGYGYHPRGIPTWLVTRMRQLRERGARIGIYFHELFMGATVPWRSAFWLAPLQRHIAGELGGLSSYWLTSYDAGARWLRGHCPQVPNRVLPVCSNVGEPEALPGPRSNTVVVFGGPQIRAMAYARLDPSFWQWVRSEGLEIHDIGPVIDSQGYRELVTTGQIQAHGPLPAADVSRHLAQARFGVLSYPTHVLAKSGVYAAYCAHGVCTLLLTQRYPLHDGLSAGRHYLAGTAALGQAQSEAQSVGEAAFAWYQPHRAEAHAMSLRELICATP
ncbi:hypothetical protein [Variovorax sp.]|uniref:hypothetical protein n=1 Tax=Variovorax sp. TaxID=1871043 RepID=UPI002D7729AD|nr:hypothetical protein [Variovorax sp.]